MDLCGWYRTATATDTEDRLNLLRTFALASGALALAACESHNDIPHEHAPAAHEIATIQSVEIAVAGAADFTSVKGFRRPAAKDAEARRVIILPGTPSDVDYWGGAMALLDPSFEVYALERPGYNGSGPERAVTDLDEQARIVGGLVENYRGTTVLIGHSFGASVALAALRRYPAEIDALIFVSPYVIPVEGRQRFWMRAAGSSPFRFIGGTATSGFFSEVFAQRRQSAALLRVAAESCAPVLIVQGEADDIIPLSDVERLKAATAACAGATLEKIPMGDHFLAVHSAEALARAINGFLRNRVADLFLC